MDHLEHLQAVFGVKQKLMISQQSANVNVKKSDKLYGRGMVAGVGDDDIRREVLSNENILSR